MRMRLTLLAFAALFAVGCGSPVEERIVGDWVLDIEATKELEALRNMPEEQRRSVIDTIEILSPRFTFTKEGTLTFSRSAGGGTESGILDYRIESVEDDRFVMFATGTDGRSKRMDCEFDGDTLVVAMEGSAVAYKRANR